MIFGSSFLNDPCPCDDVMICFCLGREEEGGGGWCPDIVFLSGSSVGKRVITEEMTMLVVRE